MAALPPTPSSDRDPGSTQRPGQQRLQTTIRIVLHFYLGTTGKGQLKERAGSGGLSFCHSFPSASGFCSVPVALLPLLVSPSLPCPCPVFLFFSSLFPWSLLFPSFLLSLSCSSPCLNILCHTLWCVLVLAKARPGRTGGYLVRQRSPWAPTPFPPPGAVQVSRWKVRGAKWGRWP